MGEEINLYPSQSNAGGLAEADLMPSWQRPTTALKTPAKLPKYNGTTPLEPFLVQVRLAARHSDWDDGETATHLALALEGTALQVLLDLAPGD